MEFIKTGVPGFDKVVNGGIRKNIALLLSGVPGTGKTIFGLQFIYFGAQNNENCLFITCEETAASILEYAKSIDIDFTRYKDKITVINQPLTGKIVSFGEIVSTIKKKNVQRVVLDSLSVFDYITTNETAYRKEIANFISGMKESGVTLLVTAERPKEHLDEIEYRAEDFLFEGLVLFSKIRNGASYERCITVAKMRGQKHLLGIYPFSLDEKGIEVFPDDLPFSLIAKEEK